MIPRVAVRASASQITGQQPGRSIAVPGARLNIACAGKGSPTVVFDAGLGDWSPVWLFVAPAIARRTRTCVYDRAGYGYSTAGRMPRTSAQIVRELHALLQNAGEHAPFVLVAHSFGSYNMRLYADTYLSEIDGMVLVDGSHEDQAALFPASATVAAQRDTRLCLRAAQRGFPSAPAEERHCVATLFRGLPEKRFPAALNARLSVEGRSSAVYAAMLSELEGFSGDSASAVRLARRSYGSMPLRIVTATDHSYPGDGLSAAQHRALEVRWRALQRSYLTLSSDARITLASRSGHYVQLDRPELVVAAIEDVVARARARIGRTHH